MQIRRAGPTQTYSQASEAPPHEQTRNNPDRQAAALQASHNIGARRTMLSGPGHERRRARAVGSFAGG